MQRAHWLPAMVVLVAGCEGGGGPPEVTAREIFPDSTAAALAEAAAEGDTSRIRRLIAAGANPNARAGADPNAADRMGDTPLHMGAKINAFERVLDLLKAGADPRATNKRGTTFQTYLDQTPNNLLHDEARRQREGIATWVREHAGQPAGSRSTHAE